MTEPTQRDEDVKGLVRQHWDDRAANFDDASEHGIHSAEQHERWLAVLREWVGEEPRRVLDVGCGTGVISLLLAELDHDVVGLDFAPEMLAQASAKVEQTDHSIPFCRGDAETLPLRDESVDCVTARHLVWTLPGPRAALREWARVLESGGRLVLLEGYWEHDEPWDEYVEMHDDLPMYDGRPADELASVLADVGYTDVTHEPLNDPVLRGGDMGNDYYVISGTVPN